MFICRGSEWEAETQGSPGQLFPPVPFLADTIRTSYMKMGGGGVWWWSEQGLFTADAGFLPALLVPTSPWPLSQGGRLKRASTAGSGQGNKEPLVPGSRGKVQSRLPRLVSFSFSFFYSVFFWLWGGGGEFFKDFYPRTKFWTQKSCRFALLLLCWGGGEEGKKRIKLNCSLGGLLCEHLGI